ncbi:MAG: glutamate ligase domain-containing protein [Flavobacteriales bacterium]
MNGELLNARRKYRREFGDIAHRLETIAEINGTEYINDAKATDVNSTWYSLLSIQDDGQGKWIWIVAVNDREIDYSVFLDHVQSGIKAIICLGEEGNHAQKCFAQSVAIWKNAESIEEAVKQSAAIASVGDKVIFSPACSGIDQFQNYRDRGEHFRRAVLALS